MFKLLEYILYLYDVFSCLFFSEQGLAGKRNKPATASVAMVHSIPELIVSESVR